MFRRILTALVASVLVCGLADLARAQAPSPKPAKSAAKQPESKPAAAAAAVAGGTEPTLIGQYGTWGAYSATPNGRRVCFALAKPSASKTNPPNRPRDPAYAFISTRPGEKVVNEVSVMIGYTLKQLGRNDEAAKYYAKALKIKPGDDMAKRLMASVPMD